MKKAIFILFVFIIFPLLYASWPVYQGLAFRGMLPMLGIGTVEWPQQQPTSFELLNSDYQVAAEKALKALSEQQRSISAPGYTAAVAINDQLVWAGSVGWADISEQKQMTTNSQLRIGSTSKALTAAGLARLVANNQFNLDAPLPRLFTELPNQAWQQITARQLASHMSGIPHYPENTELMGLIETVGAQTHFPNVLDAVELFDDSDVMFAAGEQFSYSSLGTVLLSALMQQQAGVDYQTLMQQQVFTPLQMHATTTETPTIEIDNLVTPYWQNEHSPTELKPWYNVDLSHRLAGGGWVSTSKDLVMLGQGFMNNAYIPAHVRAEFWTPQKLNNGEVNPQNYGLGWRIHQLDLGEGYEKVTFVHHGGVSAGSQSFLMVIPQYNLSLSVNANIRTKVFSDFAKVSYDIARAFIDEINQQAKI